MNRQIPIFIWFLVFSFEIQAQENIKPIRQEYTSSVMNVIGFFWKKDSQANNGFRWFASDKLLESKLDSITEKDCLQKLGKPNQIDDQRDIFLYKYFIFDIRTIPREYDAPSVCRYLIFCFSKESGRLFRIDEGEYDIFYNR